MGITGYQSRVRITQATPYDNHKLFTDPEAKYNHLISNSWLYDPFGNNSTYGVEFKLNKSFSWEFFKWAQNELEAKILGEALLLSLQEKYRGLDGKVSVIPLFSEFLEIERPLYEIKFPYVASIKFPFLKKLITFSQSPRRKVDVNMFILWKRDDLRRSPKINSFLIKIFLSLSGNLHSSLNFNEHESASQAALKFLTTDMNLPPYVKVEYQKQSPSIWKDILTNQVFPNKAKLGIGPNQNVPIELFPTTIEPDGVDFTILTGMPLPKPPILENRNLVNLPISKYDKNYIYFGEKMIDGVLSNEIAALEINSLTTHLNIFGKTGTGKSTLIKILINELCKKRPDVGILIINLVKPGLEKDFPSAEVYKFPSKTFKIPYVVLGNRVKKSITGTSKALAACLGLKYVGPVLISKLLQRCHARYRDFPHRINTFSDLVENHIKTQPWDPDTTMTISTAFRHRADELFEDVDIENTLRIPIEGPLAIPVWFVKFRKGNVVLLDLTECDYKEQHLLTMLIFHMIETLLPFVDSNELKYLVALDEAHRVIGKSRDNDPESIEFIMKNRINDYFSNIIEECRGKGLGIIISEQKPHLLLDSAIDSARTKILFSLGYPSNEIFTGNMEEREMLLTLDERYALVMKKKERFLCKTADEKEFREEIKY
jgi:hypothetical protein